MRPTIIRDQASIRSVSNRKYNYFKALQENLKNQGQNTPDLKIMDEIIKSEEHN